METKSCFILTIFEKKEIIMSEGFFVYAVLVSKKEDKDQESIQSSTTPDPGYLWESDNFTIGQHKGEPRSQPFPSR